MMEHHLVSAILFLFFGSISSYESSTYTGAVVEFNTTWDFSLSAKQNTLNNADRYVKIIEDAKNKGVDIIVFPERGLLGQNISYTLVPDPNDNVTPWNTRSSEYAALKNISQAAKDNSMYVVIHVLEESLNPDGGDPLHYSTNVVFNKSGTVISRYRKFNLFGEEYLNRTAKPEYAVFKTDFGVTFGTFTGFDFLFRDPAMTLIEKHQVTDIAFPLLWSSELPFLTALQAQQGWSLYNKASLLAAGVNSVGNGSSGSGVYSPAGNIQNVYQSVTEFNDRLIVGTVYKKVAAKSKRYSMRAGADKNLNLVLHKEDLTSYETSLLSLDLKGAANNSANQYRIVRQEGICQNGLCCSFLLDYNLTLVRKSDWKKPSDLKGDEFSYFRYRLAARDGARSFLGQYNLGVQICAVIPCLTDSLESCGLQTNTDKLNVDGPTMVPNENGDSFALVETRFNSILIQGVFQGQNSSIWPNVLETSTDPNQFGHVYVTSYNLSLAQMGNKIGAQLNVMNPTANKLEPISLVTAALYGRIFDRDGPETNSAGTFTPAVILAGVSLFVHHLLYYF